jgi:tetratricopeptide (TPR) repeat protein
MNSPLPLKCFFRGRIELGNEATYEKVKLHYLNRFEKMYKNDVCFSIEENFLEETFAIELTRDTIQLPEKSYRKSMELLRELSQYALAGRIKGWAIDSGRIIGEDVILPNNSKDAVVSYREALKISKSPGNEIKAIEQLNNSLISFERNPLAYDRRGFLSYKMGKYKDAIVDFEKSIAIFKNNPEPYYGLARCYQVAEDWTQMEAVLAIAMKASLPREAIYHTCRLYHGIAQFQLGNFDAAKVDLDAFINRPYSEDDHNLKKLYLGHKYLGKIYIRMGDNNKSLEHFNTSYSLSQIHDPIAHMDIQAKEIKAKQVADGLNAAKPTKKRKAAPSR